MTLLLACSEPMGGLRADLRVISVDLAEVEAVFAAPVVRSAGLLFRGPPFPTPKPGEPLIPDSLLGKTLAWECSTQGWVVTTDAGAPASGVRLVLLQFAANGGVVCPNTAVGQIDLFDVSTGTTRTMRVVATGTGGSAPFVDYTFTRVVTDSPLVSSAIGSINDGQERLAFQWTLTPGSTYTSVSTLQVDDSARDFHAMLRSEDQMGVDTYLSNRDITLQKAGLTVELTGSAGWFNTFRSWDERIAVNGQPFAKVSGSMVPEGSRPTIIPANGLLFTTEQRQFLDQVVSAPDSLGGNIRRVLGAADWLVNAR